MKVLRDETVPARVEQRQVAIRCDICGAESPSRTSWSEDASWRSLAVEVRLTDYMDGDLVDDETLDVCPACFREKILTLRKAP